jgi:hypothetical protein
MCTLPSKCRHLLPNLLYQIFFVFAVAVHDSNDLFNVGLYILLWFNDYCLFKLCNLDRKGKMLKADNCVLVQVLCVGVELHLIAKVEHVQPLFLVHSFLLPSYSKSLQLRGFALLLPFKIVFNFRGRQFIYN